MILYFKARHASQAGNGPSSRDRYFQVFTPFELDKVSVSEIGEGIDAEIGMTVHAVFTASTQLAMTEALWDYLYERLKRDGCLDYLITGPEYRNFKLDTDKAMFRSLIELTFVTETEAAGNSAERVVLSPFNKNELYTNEMLAKALLGRTLQIEKLCEDLIRYATHLKKEAVAAKAYVGNRLLQEGIYSVNGVLWKVDGEGEVSCSPHLVKEL